MQIRTARPEDQETLYRIGLQTPELQTNHTQPFMTEHEFRWSLTNPKGIFLLAEEQGETVGFLYVNMQDAERPMPDIWACIVYLVVVPQHRSHGVAKELYAEALRRLRALGVLHIYGWANASGTSMIESFLARQGFTAGGLYRWYDRSINDDPT